MKKKVLLATIMSLSMLAGCGTSPKSTTDATESKSVELEKKEEPTVKVHKQLTLDEITYDWSEGVLADDVPLPDAKEVEVSYDSNEGFGCDMICTLDYFKEYVQMCKDSGFTYDMDDSEIYAFSGYKEDGTYIGLFFDEDNGEASIEVEESHTTDDLKWPTRGLATLVPTPNGTKGEIVTDIDSKFFAYVGEMTEDDIHKYNDACKEAGYTDIIDDSSKYFRATNKENGYTVYTVREGVNMMRIHISPADKQKK